MFREERDEVLFEWGMIGNVSVGRPNLGSSMDVNVYRLMQFTLRDVLIREYGVAAADRIFYDAGESAGRVFFRELLSEESDFDRLTEKLQGLLKELKIGVLKFEKVDLKALNFTLTVSEDLDCSGLPVSDEVICTYDEGFLAGLFSEFTGRPFTAKEVDCWCSGDRVCRFEVKAA